MAGSHGTRGAQPTWRNGAAHLASSGRLQPPTMGGGASKAQKQAEADAAAAAAAEDAGGERWLQRGDLPPGNPAWRQPRPVPQLKGSHSAPLAGPRKPRRLAPSRSAFERPVGADAPHNPSLPKGRQHGGLNGVQTNPKTGELVVMASAAGQDPVSVLNKLKELLDSGTIDQADYDKRKHKLLDRIMEEDGNTISTDPNQNAANEAAAAAAKLEKEEPPLPDPAGWSGPKGASGQAAAASKRQPWPSDAREIRAAKVWLLAKEAVVEDLDPWEQGRWWEVRDKTLPTAAAAAPPPLRRRSAAAAAASSVQWVSPLCAQQLLPPPPPPPPESC